MGKARVDWGTIGFFVEMFALTLWVGGLIVIIAVVIPAVFNSFGMEPGGRFLRRVFDGYGYLNLGLLLVLSLVAFLRARAYGSDPSQLFSITGGEWWLLGGMLVVTVSILGILGPKALALQEIAFEAISKEEKELAYGQFFRVHMIVRALHLVNVGLAFLLFIVKLRKVLVYQLADAR
ncbi:MAG: DUF4149 domain-containing protein [Nitrospirota bacterium]|nr:DUF4149 domain-containing protein [Nitrospirota bacterium]